jgi:molecular chaperone DnaK (HSP70)
MDETRKVFGIDLGTTYSCVAQVDEYDRAVVLKNFEGDSTTPSVVYFGDDNKVVVGEPAKEESKINPDATVAFIKRQMNNDKAFDKPTKYPKGLTPSEISARILTKIVDDANAAGQYPEPIKRVVITCPAYFGDKERMRTKDAGKAAGLEVLSIINEPTAAAIAYGLHTKGKKSVLVYDLGGGTFDITLIKVDGLDIQVVATAGNANLGGYDWDKKLAKYLLEKYNQETRKSLEMKERTALFNEMMMIAEKQKQRLTARESVDIVITLNGEGESAKIALSRSDFDKMTEVLLDETIELIHKVIADGKEKGVERIDEVLLVGGSSKMPQVKQRVNSELKVEAKLTDPDECVAKGAAILALNMSVEKATDAYNLGDSEVKPKELGVGSRINVINVTSQNYGIRVFNRDEKKVYIQNMILANTPLDEKCRKEKGFSVPDGAENCGSIVFAIYESEYIGDNENKYDPEMGEPLEEHTMHIPIPVKKNAPVKVVFEIDAEGILHVHGEVKGVLDPIDFELKLKGVMNEKELKAAQALLLSERIE